MLTFRCPCYPWIVCKGPTISPCSLVRYIFFVFTLFAHITDFLNLFLYLYSEDEFDLSDDWFYHHRTGSEVGGQFGSHKKDSDSDFVMDDIHGPGDSGSDWEISHSQGSRTGKVIRALHIRAPTGW